MITERADNRTICTRTMIPLNLEIKSTEIVLDVRFIPAIQVLVSC